MAHDCDAKDDVLGEATPPMLSDLIERRVEGSKSDWAAETDDG
jgi:hypothetical protein